MAVLSQFSHAFRAALAANGVSVSQASAISKIAQSSVSRFLLGDRPIYADHVAALIKAIPQQADREHCILAFLRDQCPAEYADRLVAHFGTVIEHRKSFTGDDLDDALAAIRRAAADGNVAARKVVLNLAKAVDPLDRGGVAEAQASYIPPVDKVIAEEERRRKKSDKTQTPSATARSRSHSGAQAPIAEPT